LLTRSDAYQANADQSRRAAAEAKDETTRDRLLRIAEQWEKLAIETKEYGGE